MATLLYSATMSLDGFIAGAGGDMSWLTEHLSSGDHATARRVLASVGALLVGHNTFGGDDPNRGTVTTSEQHVPGGQPRHQPPDESQHDRSVALGNM